MSKTVLQRLDQAHEHVERMSYAATAMLACDAATLIRAQEKRIAELVTAVNGLLRYAPLIPAHFTDTTFVDLSSTVRSVRRALALVENENLTTPSQIPDDRNAVIEECAKIADGTEEMAKRNKWRSGIATAIRSLKAPR